MATAPPAGRILWRGTGLEADSPLLPALYATTGYRPRVERLPVHLIPAMCDHVAVTDDAITQSEASTAAIAELRRHFSEQEVVELLVLGLYNTVARFVRSIGLDQEPGDERLPV